MLVLNKKVFSTWGVIRKFWKAFSDLDLVWIVFSVAATFRSVSGTSVMLSVGCWRSSSVFFVLVTWGSTLKLVNCTLQLKTAVGRFLIEFLHRLELLWSIIWASFFIPLHLSPLNRKPLSPWLPRVSQALLGPTIHFLFRAFVSSPGFLGWDRPPLQMTADCQFVYTFIYKKNSLICFGLRSWWLNSMIF